VSDYSFSARVLHYLALNFRSSLRLSFEIEKRYAGANEPVANSTYVTGLARSGTTALTHRIHNSGYFASLTYANMPFVLAPSWSKLLHRFSSTNGKKQPRRHADGLEIGLQTPEAFEEVFWRLFCGDQFLDRDCLVPHDVSADIVRELATYHALVCHSQNRSRYLAKNNNLLLRLKSLGDQMPVATFLLLFRRPEDQVASLITQHTRFSNLERFASRYMEWLCHHEFGDTFRPMAFDSAPIARPDTRCPIYWLEQWESFYRYALEVLKESKARIVPVCFERIYSDRDCWDRLCSLLHINEPFQRWDVDARARGYELNLPIERLAAARLVYEELSAIAL